MPFPNPTTQFKPGQSGNPGGCPPGRSLTARLRDLLEKGEIGGKPIKDGRQVADLLMEALLKGALKGDVRHIQEVYNRVEGKVPDRIAGSDGGPIEINATVRNEASEELDAWRKEMTARLPALPLNSQNALSNVPTSSTTT